MFSGRWGVCLGELLGSYLRGVDCRRNLHEVLHLDGEGDEVAVLLEDAMDTQEFADGGLVFVE